MQRALGAEEEDQQTNVAPASFSVVFFIVLFFPRRQQEINNVSESQEIKRSQQKQPAKEIAI